MNFCFINKLRIFSGYPYFDSDGQDISFTEIHILIVYIIKGVDDIYIGFGHIDVLFMRKMTARR